MLEALEGERHLGSVSKSTYTVLLDAHSDGQIKSLMLNFECFIFILSLSVGGTFKGTNTYNLKTKLDS